MKIAYSIVISLWLSCSSYSFAQHADKIDLTADFKILKRQSTYIPSIADYQLFSISPKIISRITASDRSDFHLNIKLPYINKSVQLIETNMILNHEGLTSKKSRPDIRVLASSEPSEGTIRLTIADNFIYGYFTEKGRRYYVEPLRYQIRGSSVDEYIIYPEDAIISKGHTCAGTAAKNIPAPNTNTSSEKKANKCKIINLAIASTKDMVDRYGSVAEVKNRNIGVMNMVAADFMGFSDKIEYEIVKQYVSTSSASDPVNTTTEVESLISQFKSWAASNPWNNNFKMAQLWTARDVSYRGNKSTIGYADTPGWFQVLEDAVYANAALITTLTSHEIGHNWQAYHDSSNKNIMANNINATSQWNSAARSSINTKMSFTNPGLPSCDHTTPKPVARFNTSSIKSCSSEVIYLNDESLYGGSRSWSVNRGTLSSSTSATTKLTLPYSGSVTVTLTKSNSGGSNTKSKVINVVTNSNSYCKPSNNFGTGGISYFDLSLANNSVVVFSHKSELASEIGSYTDYSCHRTINLKPSTTYDVTYTASSKSNSGQKLWLYIDYNDNGSYNTTNELVTTSTQYWLSGPVTSGNPSIETGLRFTIPNNVSKNKLLRVRVKSDKVDSNNPCYVSSKGQIKDYFVRFGDNLCNTKSINVNSVSANNQSFGGDTETLNSGAVINMTNISFAAEKGINLNYPFEVKMNKSFTATTGKCPD